MHRSCHLILPCLEPPIGFEPTNHSFAVRYLTRFSQGGVQQLGNAPRPRLYQSRVHNLYTIAAHYWYSYSILPVEYDRIELRGG